MIEIKELIKASEARRNKSRALQMSAYMRNNFEFLGISAPEQKDLLRQCLPSTWNQKEAIEFAQEAYLLKEREYQNMAVRVLMQTSLDEDALPYLEKFITTKSWWDTVDMLSARSVGDLVAKHKSLLKEMDNWNRSQNIWLVRASLLFQLHWKEQTDFARLKRYNLQHQKTSEFFIAKAMGWSLRQYAKTNPDPVLHFVNNANLPALTKREARKAF